MTNLHRRNTRSVDGQRRDVVDESEIVGASVLALMLVLAMVRRTTPRITSCRDGERGEPSGSVGTLGDQTTNAARIASLGTDGQDTPG